MKHTVNGILAALIALSLFLGGCQSQTTFKSIKAVGLTVDAASMAWADYVVAGKASIEDQAKVREAHNKFRASYGYAIDIAKLDPKSAPPQELTILALNLINLISELQK